MIPISIGLLGRPTRPCRQPCRQGTTCTPCRDEKRKRFRRGDLDEALAANPRGGGRIDPLNTEIKNRATERFFQVEPHPTNRAVGHDRGDTGVSAQRSRLQSVAHHVFLSIWAQLFPSSSSFLGIQSDDEGGTRKRTFIGKGKASAPYEFGVKASIVTSNARAPGGQFVLHAKALPGNPYDGHTLGTVIDATEKLTGCAIKRAYVDKGYRGHDAANPRRVFISGQKRGVFGVIKRELRRRSAIEAVIGHMKNEGHLGRCYLKGRAGDAANVILTAVGYNLRLVLAWLRTLLRLILDFLLPSLAIQSPLKPAC